MFSVELGEICCKFNSLPVDTNYFVVMICIEFLIDILLTLSTAKIWHTVSIKAGIIHVFGITLKKKKKKIHRYCTSNLN